MYTIPVKLLQKFNTILYDCFAQLLDAALTHLPKVVFPAFSANIEPFISNAHFFFKCFKNISPWLFRETCPFKIKLFSYVYVV